MHPRSVEIIELNVETDVYENLTYTKLLFDDSTELRDNGIGKCLLNAR